MTVKNTTENIAKENLVDDLDQDKLAALKARLNKKTEESNMASKIVGKKEKSIDFGIVGSGQCGTNLVLAMSKLGYDGVVMNTAQQDLKLANLPEENKLLLEGTLGGAAKDLSIGKAAIEHNADAIRELVKTKLGNKQMLIFCTSLAGGSGSGSVVPMIELLSEMQMPIVVIAALPMNSDDAQGKQNSLVTLSELTKFLQSKKIVNLIVVDNSKIEAILHNVNQMEFFEKANEMIVNPIDVFNTYSCMPSPVKALDSMELVKLMCDGEGLSIYGSMDVANYTDETAIASAVIDNLDNNLLASGFDVKHAKYVGVIVVANKKVWSQIPSSSINYGMSMIQDKTGTPLGIFKGIYQDDSIKEDVVKVYSLFSGLSLPTSRIDQLKKETQEHISTLKNKDVNRNLSLTIDTGNSSVSDAQKIKDKIAAKSSAFGKFTQSIIDRRK